MRTLLKYQKGGKKYEFNPGQFLNNRSDNTTLVINTANGPKTIIAPNSVPKINLNEIVSKKKEADKRELARRKAAIKASNDAKPLSRESFQNSAAGEKFRFFPNDPNNVFDDYLNPLKMVGDMADGIGNAWTNPEATIGDKALSIATPLAVGALGSIGAKNTGQFINNLSNPLAGTGELITSGINKVGNKYLPNAYKLNPNALKEAQEQMLVRARPIGQDPYINMAESLKAKEAAGEQLKWYQKNLLNPQTNPNIAAREKYFGQWFADNPSDLDFYINPGTRNFADDAQIEILKARMPKSEASKYSVKNFEDAKKLSNLHDTEFILPKDMVQQLERHSVDDLSKLTKEYNEINKPHWLKGYKEIPKPKSNFKSEIDWGKWNKEIPDNKALMQEYNTIEQQAKTNGNWMKNPDGSPFQGTPEQFVQQNSSNFKKAFSNSVLKDEKDNPMILNHFSKAKFDTFDESRFNQNFSGRSGAGIYVTPDESAPAYLGTDLNKYQLYGNSQKLATKESINNTGLPFNRYLNRFNNSEFRSPIDRLDEFDAAFSPTTGITGDATEYVFKKNTQVKSAVGNNGMFDMTNPNIYKGLIPAIGVGAAAITDKKELGGKINKNQITKLYFQPGGSIDDPIEEDNKRRRALALKVVENAKNRIKNNNYAQVPKNVIDAAEARGESANSCIGGVCTVLNESGAIPEVNWSNTDFSLKAKSYGFKNNGYGVKGIKNLEPGDVLQYAHNQNDNGTYFPSHAVILTEIDSEGNYHFFDNANGEERIKSKEDLEYQLDPKRTKKEQHASIYKINPYSISSGKMSPEAKQALEDRSIIKSHALNNESPYIYSIREDAKDYNENTKKGMQKFVDFANNEENINKLVEKTGKDKSEIHDTLLNVFGMLGQEGQWQNKYFTGSWGIEGLTENILSGFNGGKNKSVGPGQIKFNQISKKDRELYGIKKVNDLYDWEKIIPLMVHQDLLNKKQLEDWGRNNTLSDKLIGITDNENPLRASELKGGVGRWSPYLRNQYASMVSKKIMNKGEFINNFIPGKKGLLEPFKFDKNSYADKVFRKTDDNLERKIKTKPKLLNNDDGYFTPKGWKKVLEEQDNLPTQILSEVILRSKRKPKLQSGGLISQMGYRDDSPYKHKPFINIKTPSGLIDMSNTGIPLLAKDNTGMIKYLKPYSGMHQFKGTEVLEQKLQNGTSFTKGGLVKQKICLPCEQAKRRYQPGGIILPNLAQIIKDFEKNKPQNLQDYFKSQMTTNYLQDTNQNGYVKPEDRVQPIPNQQNIGDPIGRVDDYEQKANLSDDMLLKPGESVEDWQKRQDLKKEEEKKKKKFPWGTILKTAIPFANVGLSMLTQKKLESEQNDYYQQQIGDMNYNPSYSFAKNDYGASNNRYLAYQKGGQFLNTSFNLSPNNYLKNPTSKFDRRGYPIPTFAQYKADPEFFGMAPSKSLLGKYSSVEGDGTGQPNPHSQYGKLMNNLEFMKNNIWTESNNYRPENMHIAADYNTIKENRFNKLPIAEDGGEIDDDDDFFNFLYDDDDKNRINESDVKQAQEKMAKKQQRIQERMQQDAMNEQLAMEQLDNSGSGFKMRGSFGEEGEGTYTGNASSNVNVGNNEKTAYDYYVNEKGLPKHVAAGIVGNLSAESNVKPLTYDDGANGAGGGGVAQWSPTRYSAYKKWASKNNRTVNDLKSQLDYILVEAEQRGDLNRTMNTQSAAQAATVFGKTFLRPQDRYLYNGERQGKAENIYKKFKVGGEYELSQSEINNLILQGYKINLL